MPNASNEKRPYVCGPLTELPVELQEPIKFIYSHIGDLCQTVLGVRGFVPHEHYDPVHNPDPDPAEVNEAERRQVGKLCSCLIVMTPAPSWGGGIEVEIAHRSGVPILITRQVIGGRPRSISRLLRGNPSVKEIIDFVTYDELFEKLKVALSKYVPKVKRIPAASRTV